MELASLGGALRLCRCGGIELGSLGGALQACRRRGIELWRRDVRVGMEVEGYGSSGTLEVRCGRADVEA